MDAKTGLLFVECVEEEIQSTDDFDQAAETCS